MLDTDTKRRIDTARDILVGKVPDPKSQVEQITIALIYKFMDDMDAEAEELGGQRKFFAGEFARYGWAKLMRSGLGGHETLNLYAEAIAKMPENPGIPPLFRDIFKNAFLPYRDPETLRAFLKIIDEFAYDHSERLGDAFEYLLSVLGSQGDAGQFRTPRHIIDFIVAIIDPKKNETVLDPACGTAGFLISSYKHILRANTDAKGHSTLTPDDKARLARNFNGYDISPDMVRLSLVNLYLHGFADPHIHEYDTLTSQDRWNETADVILANPPFMSPKGGIKPHNRFSVQSKRSEVLFVDYMAEHLTPGGRAGIIVPEGIIFQSQTAYTQLRKMLVEEYLVAVVSLPAGVFNPYSGVKTSILILDRNRAKRRKDIAFFKVENDGFGLGAQRRAIEKNDLPEIAAALKEWLNHEKHENDSSAPPFVSFVPFVVKNALFIPKEKIAANGDYNLSGERYREGVANVSSWPLVPVSEAFRKSEESLLPETLAGPVTYLGLENLTQGTGDITGAVVTENPADIKSLKNVFKPSDILYGKLRPNLNKVWVADRKGICSTDIFVIEAVEGKADPALFAYIFRSQRFNDAVMGQLKGAQLPRIGWSSFAELPIPLPPLEVQKEIVAEIEGYQKVINGARAVLDHYRPHIPIHPDWPMVELGEVIEAKPKNGYSGKPVDRVTELKVLTLSATTSGKLDLTKFKYLNEDIPQNAACRCREGDIYLQRGNTAELVGTAALFDVDEPNFIYPDLMIRVRADEAKIATRYLLTALQSQPVRDFLTRNAVGAAGSMPKINQGIVELVPIPLPPLATQQAIVAEIEAEQALVAANRDLIARMEKKIAATLARVWGEDAACSGAETA
jgi:type I restriction enzyme M protein